MRSAIVLLHAFGVVAATPNCFMDPVWQDDEIKVISDIPYGSAFNNQTNQTQTLLLDAYLPPDSDKRTERPTVVFVHGGAFMSGEKDMGGEKTLMTKLATRGFAAVSIDYRLTGKHYNWTGQEMIYDAVEDARAAVRYVRSVAEEYRIDTGRILLMGESAGAVTSLFYGYVESAQYEGNSGNPGFSSEIHAVGSISGSLKTMAFCEGVHPFPHDCQVDEPIDRTDSITGQNQVPLMLIHGTEDTVTPYVNGKAAFYQAQEVGLPSALITIQGAYHVPWEEIWTEKYFTPMMQNIIDGLDLAHAESPEGCEPPQSELFMQ